MLSIVRWISPSSTTKTDWILQLSGPKVFTCICCEKNVIREVGNSSVRDLQSVQPRAEAEWWIWSFHISSHFFSGCFVPYKKILVSWFTKSQKKTSLSLDFVCDCVAAVHPITVFYNCRPWITNWLMKDHVKPSLKLGNRN